MKRLKIYECVDVPSAVCAMQRTTQLVEKWMRAGLQRLETRVRGVAEHF